MASLPDCPRLRAFFRGTYLRLAVVVDFYIKMRHTQCAPGFVQKSLATAAWTVCSAVVAFSNKKMLEFGPDVSCHEALGGGGSEGRTRVL